MFHLPLMIDFHKCAHSFFFCIMNATKNRLQIMPVTYDELNSITLCYEQYEFIQDKHYFYTLKICTLCYPFLQLGTQYSTIWHICKLQSLRNIKRSVYLVLIRKNGSTRGKCTVEVKLFHCVHT